MQLGADRWNAFALIAPILLAGCTSIGTPDEDARIFAWPKVGASATYVLVDDGGRVAIDVGEPDLVVGLDRERYLLLPLRYNYTYPNPSGGDEVHVVMTQWVDADGRAALVTAPCNTVPGVRSKLACRSEGGAASFMEAGTHAFHGVGAFWGTPAAPAVRIDAVFLATKAEVVLDAARDEGCVAFSAPRGGNLGEWATTEVHSNRPASSVRWCEDAAWPREIAYVGREPHRMTLLGSAPGGREVDVTLLGRPPTVLSRDAAPEAARLENPWPRGAEVDNPEFPLGEAYGHLTTKDPTASAFVRGGPTRILETLSSSASVESSYAFDTANLSDRERTVTVVRSDGATLHAVMQRTCALTLHCEMRVLSVEEGGRVPYLADVRVIPFGHAVEKAEEYLGKADGTRHGVGQRTRQEDPYRATGRYVVQVFGAWEDDALFSVPPNARVDGSNGDILRLEGRADAVERLVGLSRDRL